MNETKLCYACMNAMLNWIKWEWWIESKMEWKMNLEDEW